MIRRDLREIKQTKSFDNATDNNVFNNEMIREINETDRYGRTVLFEPKRRVAGR